VKSLFTICAIVFLHLGQLLTAIKCNLSISGKLILFDGAGNSIRAKDGKITVTLTKKDLFSCVDDDEEDALRGDIKNFVCDWKDVWKDG
jgi:hypothetical protein